MCAGDAHVTLVAIPGRRSWLSVGAGKNNFMQGLRAKLALGGVNEPQEGCARSQETKHTRRKDEVLRVLKHRKRKLCLGSSGQRAGTAARELCQRSWLPCQELILQAM